MLRDPSPVTTRDPKASRMMVALQLAYMIGRSPDVDLAKFNADIDRAPGTEDLIDQGAWFLLTLGFRLHYINAFDLERAFDSYGYWLQANSAATGRRMEDTPLARQTYRNWLHCAGMQLWQRTQSTYAHRITGEVRDATLGDLDKFMLEYRPVVVTDAYGPSGVSVLVYGRSRNEYLVYHPLRGLLRVSQWEIRYYDLRVQHVWDYDPR